MKLKNSYALLSVLILIIIFSFLSINYVQNKSFSSKINELKYLHLQANIHMGDTKKFILNHNNFQIKNYILLDNRYNLKININDLNNSSKIYHIYIQTNDQNHIRIYDKVIK